MLLDEPTNDLDLDGLERLEAFVRGIRGGVVLVSHDREFLARCVTRVLELDLAQHSNRVFGGGYDAYLEERATARRQQRETYEEFAEKKADLVARARTQREWSSQGVRNAMKKSPDNDKIRRKAATESSEKQAQKVRQMESRIARLDEVEEPRKEWQLEFTIGRGTALELGRLDAQRSRGRGRATSRSAPCRCRWTPASASASPARTARASRRCSRAPARPARRPTRAASSLGAIVRDRRDRPGAHPAHRRRRRSRRRSRRSCPRYTAGEVRTLLAKFGLKADHVLRPVDALSPGERTRAGLALLQARGVNVLVLDEPTNHLDLAAIEQLEQALESYEGTLLLVTHDRRMLENVRLDRRWHVEAGRVTDR